MWSYLLSAAGITGLLVAARHPRAGWTINIGAQGLWAVYAIATGQHGFLLAAAAYTVAYVRLLRRAGVAQPTPTVDSGRYRARVIRARLLPAAALLVALALAGCGSSDKPLAAASPTPPAAAPTSAAAATTGTSADTSAQEACKAAAAAEDATTGDDPAVMAPVAAAAQKSTDPTIASAGLLLSRAVDRATAAAGASDELAMKAGLAAATIQFSAACTRAGLVY